MFLPQLKYYITNVTNQMQNQHNLRQIYQLLLQNIAIWRKCASELSPLVFCKHFKRFLHFETFLVCKLILDILSIFNGINVCRVATKSLTNMSQIKQYLDDTVKTHVKKGDINSLKPFKEKQSDLITDLRS